MDELFQLDIEFHGANEEQIEDEQQADEPDDEEDDEREEEQADEQAADTTGMIEERTARTQCVTSDCSTTKVFHVLDHQRKVVKTSLLPKEGQESPGRAASKARTSKGSTLKARMLKERMLRMSMWNVDLSNFLASN